MNGVNTKGQERMPRVFSNPEFSRLKECPFVRQPEIKCRTLRLEKSLGDEGVFVVDYAVC